MPQGKKVYVKKWKEGLDFNRYLGSFKLPEPSPLLMAHWKVLETQARPFTWDKEL